jgi:alpha-tubulin suppressor-like RCC1 family protein
MADGSGRCWGTNPEGQLGDGTTVGRAGHELVKGLVAAGSTRLGVSHSCALLTGGTVWCWGSRLFGRIGDGNDTFTPAPVSVLGIG